MSQHDNSYKTIFSHPEMVRDLLTGFVQEPWLAELDLSTLEKASGSYVSDDLRDREDDIIWRVRMKGRWLYLYILLEFQSSVDAFMAVRVLTYLGLLYQDLIKQGKFSPQHKLPPVLPIVLYHGKPRWKAATEVSQLIEPPPGRLADFTPKLGYLLLDESTIDESGPLALKNLVAALFRLEKSRTTATVQQTLEALIDWLGDPAQASLRRAFTVWIKRVFLPARLPGVQLPDVGDLMEIKTMLEESVVEWTEQWRLAGLKQGFEQGIEEGFEQGIEEGIEQGIEQGIEIGVEQGLTMGEAKVLERLLIRRFGALSDEARSRLKMATSSQLELWADRILDASSQAAVFADH